MATILPEGKQSFTNSAGDPLAGGKLYTYAAGTSTPKATYADSGAVTPNANPVIMDARGEATIFWDGVYKAILKDSADSLIWSVDNISSTGDSVSLATLASSAGSSLVGFLQAGTGAVARTAQSKMRDFLSLTDFGADPTGAADATSAMNAALAYCASSNKSLFIPAGTYLLTSNITVPRTGNTQYGYGIFGEGKHHASILKFSGAAVTTGLDFESAGAGTYQYWDTIRDFEILCVGGAQACMTVNYSHHMNVDSVQFNGAAGIGLFLHNCNNPRVSNCLFINCGTASYGQAELDYCTDFMWDGNYIAGSASAGWGMRIDRCPTGVVLGGSIESTGIPIEIAGKAEAVYACRDISIIGTGIENATTCYIKAGYGYAALVIQGLTLIGVKGYLSGSTTASIGVDLNRTYDFRSINCDFGLVAAPTCQYNLNGTANHNIQIDSRYQMYGYAYPWVIVNGSQDMDASPYYDYNNLSPKTCSRIKTVSGSTATLDNSVLASQGGMYDHIYVANGGATTINNTAYVPTIDGSRMTIGFADGNTTIAHAAGGAGQFVLKAGASLVGANNQTVEFIFFSGAWRQIGS